MNSAQFLKGNLQRRAPLFARRPITIIRDSCSGSKSKMGEIDREIFGNYCTGVGIKKPFRARRTAPAYNRTAGDIILDLRESRSRSERTAPEDSRSRAQ